MTNSREELRAIRIREKYTEKSETKMDKLRALDKRVTRPAKIFAYIFGSFGALIMGAGMSLIMTDIGSMIGIGTTLIPGAIIGTIGLALTLVTQPIYSGILSARRAKYAEKILKLSDEIINK